MLLFLFHVGKMERFSFACLEEWKKNISKGIVFFNQVSPKWLMESNKFILGGLCKGFFKWNWYWCWWKSWSLHFLRVVASWKDDWVDVGKWILKLCFMHRFENETCRSTRNFEIPSSFYRLSHPVSSSLQWNNLRDTNPFFKM